jgi:N6-adenosine-specific RNA methylase IME4
MRRRLSNRRASVQGTRPISDIVVDLEFHALANLFPLIEGADFDALVDDIRAHGVREPIWTLDGKILDGRNRYLASRSAGVVCPVRTYEGNDPAAFVVSLNLARRHLDEVQRAMIAAKLATMHQGARTDLSPIGETSQAAAAKLLNVGKRSVERAARVRDKATPELLEAVEQGGIAISVAADLAAEPVERQHDILSALQRDADGKLSPEAKKALTPVVRELRAEKMAALKTNREAKHRAIHAAATGKMVLDQPGPFSLIYADPPWKFEVYSELGMAHSPDMHYPTLSYGEIADFRVAGLSIPEIAHKDAALLLWCTSGNIPAAIEIMKAWGFEFSASAVWDKQKIALGYVFRNQHEVLLYGVRGNMPAPQYKPPSVFKYQRGAHSAKPPEIRGIIEQMFPDFDETTRLELFARGDKVPGWTVYGLEATAMMEAAQ